MTIAQALQLSVEEIQGMNGGQLAELHKLLSDSKQRKANRKADLVAGIIKAKNKEADSEEIEQQELELVENSKKPAPKRKAPKKTASKKTATKKDAPKKEEQSEEEGNFPDVIKGSNVQFVATEFKTLKDLQKQLVARPYEVHLFIDEAIDDDLTQFLVLFANADTIVLLDRSRHKDETLCIEWKNIKNNVLTFEKNKFEVQFYVREAIKKEESA